MKYLEIAKKNAQYIGYAGCVLLLIGNFLPFLTVKLFGLSQSINFIDTNGKIVVVAAIIAGVLFFLKKDKFATIPAGISLAVIIYNIADTDVLEYSGYGVVSFGFGFWLLILGIILIIGSAVLDFLKSKQISVVGVAKNVGNQPLNQFENQAETMNNSMNQSIQPESPETSQVNSTRE
ncbi:MAG: hypothetical protein PUB18_03230 [bacterium]|nr:hypothetical protein [bacterium]